MTEFIDLTDSIQALISSSGISVGIVNIQALHTTTGLVVNEDEPLLLSDFESTLERAVPCDAVYEHDDATRRTVNLTPNERVNGHAHCRALFLATSVCLNIVDGRVLLGRWQRVFLAELDGPRERTISVMAVSANGDGSRFAR